MKTSLRRVTGVSTKTAQTKGDTAELPEQKLSQVKQGVKEREQTEVEAKS